MKTLELISTIGRFALLILCLILAIAAGFALFFPHLLPTDMRNEDLTVLWLGGTIGTCITWEAIMRNDFNEN